MYTRTDKTRNYLHLIVLLLFCGIVFVPQISALSDKRLCADPNCQEIISLGTGKINYPAGDEGMVSFKINSQIRIKSKSAGSDVKLWGIEVNGREGYAPKELIMETKVLISEKNLRYEVPVKLIREAAPTVAEAVASTAPISEPPTLNPSESAEVKVSDVEATTTAPLGEVVKEQPIVISTDEATALKPQQASPVQQKVEIVDGTELPILDDPYTPSGEMRKEDNSATVDDDDVDYYIDRDEEFDVSKEGLEKVLDASTNAKMQTSEKVQPKKTLAKTNVPAVKSLNTGAEVNTEAAVSVNVAAETTNALKDAKTTTEILTGDVKEIPKTFENELNKELGSNNAVKVESTTNENENENASTADTKPFEGISNDTKEQYIADSSNQHQASNLTQIVRENVVGAGVKLNESNTAEEVPVETPNVDSENIVVVSQASQTETQKVAESTVLSEKVETPPHVTEPGFAYHSEHYNIISFDTTTMPTIISQEIITQNAAEATSLAEATAEIQVPQQLPSVESTTQAAAPLTLQETDETIVVENSGKSESSVLNTHDTGPTKAATTKLGEAVEEEINPNIKNELPISQEIITPSVVNEDPKNSMVAEATAEIQVPQQLPSVESTTQAAAPLTLQETDETIVVENSGKSESFVFNTHDTGPAKAATTKLGVAEVEQVNPNIKNELPVAHKALNVPTTQAQQQMQGQAQLSVQTQAQAQEQVQSQQQVQSQEQVQLQEQALSQEQVQSQEEVKVEPQEQVQAQDMKTSSSQDQVPINNIPTTLPLFRQPQSTIQEPHNHHHSGEIHQNTNEDPNEYYRLKAEEASVPAQQQYTAPPLPPIPTPYYEPTLPESLEPEEEEEEKEQKENNSDSVEETEVNAEDKGSPKLNADSSENNKNEDAEVGIGSIESLAPMAMPSQAPTLSPPSPETPTAIPEIDETKKDGGLFATIVGTVNSFLSSNDNKKEKLQTSTDDLENAELQRILFPERGGGAAPNGDNNKQHDVEMLYCEKLSAQDCPSHLESNAQEQKSSSDNCQYAFADITWDNFATILSGKVLEMRDLLACLSIAAAASIFFLFGYYCFCNSSREGALLSKLNMLERSLLATHKENAILKQDLMSTRSKLSSIEDNSFGSNDMVMSLRKELEVERIEKFNLQEQVNNLGKELEQAAEAGLELNRIVSEVLSNQSGDESIISSVEELQKQLNEQQNTILEINANLADKSRENSELQLMIAEQNARLGGEIASLQQDNEELESDKNTLKSHLDEVKGEFEEDITKALEGKNFEIKRLQSEIVDLTTKCETEHTKWQTSLAKVEALEDCLKSVKRDPNVNISQVIDVVNIRAELLDMQKQRNALKERLDMEMDARKLADEQNETIIANIEKVKLEFHQSEKDKLEAQTRLEVLSNYFKDKETQLQKELSLKEALWLKQHGETTSTVERVTAMQEEIQSLKSQNDSLRAEIEAQLAAHKAQIGTLEHRALDSYLEARQFQRRYEEIRTESYALRRKLTTLAGGEPNADVKLNNTDLNNAPSPLSLDSPGSPMIPFLPPPFIPPFLGMPPPPFVPPPGEMRPPPLGRIMSPPPAAAGISGGVGGIPPPPPHLHSRSGRYSPPSPYDRYDDDYYDDDEDDDVELPTSSRRRRGSGLNCSWQRDDFYSPLPRIYRSHSPADSRYNYTADRDLMSTYDTETDFSPPPSPRDHRRTARGSRAGSYKAYSPQPTASSPISNSNNNNTSSSKKILAAAKTTNKGVLSSGSEKSSGKSSQRGKKKNKSIV